MFNRNCLKKNYFSSALNILLATGVLSMLMACNWEEKKELTYFGGKIKNPRSEFVFLSRNNVILDSAKLDDHNKFHFELDSIEEGLYRFKHGPEYQYLYLQPQDSLLLYLNTWDFDESLIYSGKGSIKNNFLINLYLQQEKIDAEFDPYFELDEEAFNGKIDEGIEKKMAMYEKMKSMEEEPPSPFFDNLAKAGILFPYYRLKEAYPFWHMWAHKMEGWPELSDDYYAYRNNIDLNDNSLIDYAPYTAYMDAYTRVSAHAEKHQKGGIENFELRVMELTKENIPLEIARNHLLAKYAFRSLSYEDLNDQQMKEIRAFFVANCSDDKLKSNITKSFDQKSKLKRGDNFPKVQLTNASGSKTDIHNLIEDNNTVIYFWPDDVMYAELVRVKLSKYEKKYPDILFVGINMDKDQAQWVEFLEANKIKSDHQFRMEPEEECYPWFEGDMARAVLLNSDSEVLYSYLDFSGMSFDYYFKAFKKP